MFCSHTMFISANITLLANIHNNHSYNSFCKVGIPEYLNECKCDVLRRTGDESLMHR